MRAKAILGLILTAVAASIAGGGVYTVQTLKLNRFDPHTLCPQEGSRAAALILIDKTDPLTDAEKVRASALAAAEAASARRGDRITVRLLKQKEAAGIALETAADLCNPGAEANPLYENPKRVAARYRNAFREPIEDALADVEETGPAQASPIAQAIQESLAALPESPGQRLKLILVSDLMEHTPEASAYTGALNEAALRRTIPRGAQERLRGAEIRVLLLARPRYAKQQAAAIAAWRSLFVSVTQREPEFLQP